jgi:hypothetical protein
MHFDPVSSLETLNSGTISSNSQFHPAQPLFVDGDSVSFPFLENFNNSKVERDGIENSTIANDSAIGYNSLQS